MLIQLITPFMRSSYYYMKIISNDDEDNLEMSVWESKVDLCEKLDMFINTELNESEKYSSQIMLCHYDKSSSNMAYITHKKGPGEFVIWPPLSS